MVLLKFIYSEKAIKISHFLNRKYQINWKNVFKFCDLLRIHGHYHGFKNPYTDDVIEGGSTRWYPENAMQLHIYHGLLKYKESMHKDEKIIT